MIYLNYVGRALTYTIVAVSQGNDQSVYVNGAKVGTVADAAFSKTEYIGLGIVNSGSRQKQRSLATSRSGRCPQLSKRHLRGRRTSATLKYFYQPSPLCSCRRFSAGHPR